MASVPLTQSGAPLEGVVGLDGTFYVCFTTQTADVDNRNNVATTYSFNPRYLRVPYGSRNGPEVTMRCVVLANGGTTSDFYPNVTADNSAGTLSNWRFMRNVGANGLYLFIIEDSGEYFFDATGTFASRTDLYLQLRRVGTTGNTYTIGDTTGTATRFIDPNTDPYTYNMTLNTAPTTTANQLSVDLRIHSILPVAAASLPAGSIYYLRSFFAGLIFQTFDVSTPDCRLTPNFTTPPESAAIAFLKVDPSQTASGTNTNTYIMYFPRGKMTTGQATPAPVYLSIDIADSNKIKFFDTASVSDKKFHFEVRLASDVLPTVPDTVGLVTLFHTQSSKFIASRGTDQRNLLSVASAPTAFVAPGTDTAAVANHLYCFDLLQHCFADRTPWPANTVVFP